MENETTYILCNNPLEGDVVIVSKGLTTILQSSIQRKDGIYERLEGKTSIGIHQICRHNYTRPTSIAAAISPVQQEGALLPSTST